MEKNKSTNPDREAFKSLLQSVERLSQEDVDYLMEDLILLYKIKRWKV